jgi:hypothetical protein
MEVSSMNVKWYISVLLAGRPVLGPAHFSAGGVSAEMVLIY